MIVLGRIAAPYGVRGWVKVQPYGDDPLAWSRMPQWWLGAGAGASGWAAHALLECRSQGSALVARLAGIEDREAAEKLRGALVGAPREALPATAEDEYYWADLIGLAVVNEAGESLGRVAGLIETGAHQVLAVSGAAGQQRLLPFVAAVVKGVDRHTGVIRVDWQADW
jgi:16S rRNA processing protein RimM